MSPNSLFGAMSIGGMALALRLREVWASIQLNETHPKVLLHELGRERYDAGTVQDAVRWLADRSSVKIDVIRNEHELDAALSAWSTKVGIEQGWFDLVANQEGMLFLAGRVSYLWPRELGSL